MRGPKPAYPIALTAEEAKRLQHLIRAHTTPQTLAAHAFLPLADTIALKNEVSHENLKRIGGKQGFHKLSPVETP